LYDPSYHLSPLSILIFIHISYFISYSAVHQSPQQKGFKPHPMLGARPQTSTGVVGSGGSGLQAHHTHAAGTQLPCDHHFAVALHHLAIALKALCNHIAIT
jgi:hypothetical protein